MCDGLRVKPLGLHGPDLSGYVMVFVNCNELCCGVVYLIGGGRLCRQYVVECLGGMLGVG